MLYGSGAGQTDPSPQDPQQLMQEWLRPADARRHGELLQATMRGEGDLRNELLVRNPATGAETWVEASATLVRDAAGRPSRVLGIIQNVTQRKQAETAQREREKWQWFLLQLSDALRAPPDAESITKKAVSMVAEHLGLDRCYVSEVFEEQGFSTVGPEQVRSDLPPMAGVYRLADYPETMRQLETQAMLVQDAASDPRFADSEKALLARLQMRALLVVPLRKGQRHVIWALAAAMATPRAWTEGERVLLEEVAERTWGAVERARAEAALRASEEQYRTLFETMDQGFALCELVHDHAGRAIDYRVLEINPAYERHTGTIDADVVGRLRSEFDAVRNEQTLGLCAQVVATGEPLRFDYRNEGLQRWFNVGLFPRLGDHFAAVFTDITERKRAEEAVRESEERLRRILDGMGEAFGLLAPDFTILEHNREALRLDGRAREDIVGRSHWDVFPGSETSELGALLKQAMAERVPVSLEHQYAWEQGRALWLEMRAYPTSDGSLAVFWRDVTARREAEGALRQSEEKYRTLFETMTQAYALNELVRDARGRVVDVRLLELNPAFGRLLGVPFEEARGRTTREVMPLIEDWWFESCERIVRRGEPARFEHEMAALGRWYEVSVYPGGGDRFSVIYDDITARRTAETALRESEARQAFLLKLSDALRPLEHPARIKLAATRLLGEQLAVNRVFYADAEGGHWLVAEGYESGVNPLPDQPFPMSTYGEWIISGFRAGTRLVVTDMRADSRFAESERQAHLALHIGSELAVPLVKGGDLVAMLVAHDANPRDWSELEIALLEETAERTWAAVERARAEAALRESEARYRTLFDSIDEGFCTIEVLFDAEAEPVDYVFLETNPAFLQQTGLVEAVGRRMRELAPEHEPFWFDTYGRIAQTGTPERFEHRADALGHWYEVYAFRIGRPEQHRVAILFNDITLRKQAEAEHERLAVAEAVAAERQALLEAVVRAQEEERRHLARELHDEIGQALTGLQLQLAAFRRGQNGRDAALEAEQIVRDLTARVSHLSVDLRPSTLDTLGLLPALLSHVERYRARTELRIDLRHDGLERRFPPSVEITAYRVVQEALTNIVRHSGARNVTVQLLADDDSLNLAVRDDGRGFDLHTSRRTGGLSGMRERVELLGGTLTIDTAPEAGTLITAELPLRDGPAAELQADGA